jgi:hypothetical protein
MGVVVWTIFAFVPPRADPHNMLPVMKAMLVVEALAWHG